MGFEGVHISRTCFPDVSVRCQEVQEVIKILFQQRKKHLRRENNGACSNTRSDITNMYLDATVSSHVCTAHAASVNDINRYLIAEVDVIVAQ